MTSYTDWAKSYLTVQLTLDSTSYGDFLKQEPIMISHALKWVVVFKLFNNFSWNIKFTN